jgi:hypothetical protein
VLLLTGGCGGGKKPKFTEKELAAIPLAQRTDLPKASGGFVFAVGGEIITSDEIVLPIVEDFKPFARRNSFERFKEQVRPELERALRFTVTDILLYQEAKKDVGEQFDEVLEKAVEQEVRKFVVGFGSDYAKAEQALKRGGMDWQSFREYQKKVILTQYYITSQLPDERPITYSELVDAYNEMIDEFFSAQVMLKFELIDIEPAKLEVADANQSRREQAARLANELMEQIEAGEDPGKLAETHSGVSFIDHSEGVRPESLEKPYDVLAAEAEKIEAGQIAGPIEAGEHIFIMKLEEKQTKGLRPLEDVQGEVENKIRFDRRREAVNKLTAKLLRQVDLSNIDAFIDFCVEKIYRLSTQEE